MQRKTRFRLLRIALYLVLFLAFALWPYEGVAGGFFRCPSTLVGLQCPGCGVTRAMSLVMHGRISEAFGMNQIFTLILFPAFVLTAAQDVFITVTGKKCSFLEYLLGLNGSEIGGK